MKRRTGILLIIIAAAFANSQAPASSNLVRVGGISAENGVFGLQDRLITAYTDQTISVEFGSDSKRQFLHHSGSASFEVKGESMQWVQNNIPLTLAHEFQFCDSLNQVDISMRVDKEILLILPKNAKIKSTEDLSDNRTLVVYAEPDSRVIYKISMALVQGKLAQKYTMIGNDTVSSYGNFCGTQALTQNLRAILVDEPAGSSDFSAIYIYAIKP